MTGVWSEWLLHSGYLLHGIYEYARIESLLGVVFAKRSKYLEQVRIGDSRLLATGRIRIDQEANAFGLLASD